MQLTMQSPNLRTLYSLSIGGMFLLLPTLSMAATADTNSSVNLAMILIVATAAIGSAALPVSAFKVWTGYWKLVAAIPLLFLAGWCAWIVIARLLDAAAHPYWLLEIFAWAMLTLLYMATVFTARRQFEKADNPDNS